MEWIKENAPWIFSGIGISIISAVVAWINYYYSKWMGTQGGGSRNVINSNATASEGGTATTGGGNIINDHSVVNNIRNRPNIIPILLLFAVFGCFSIMWLALVASEWIEPSIPENVINEIVAASLTAIPNTSMTIIDTPIVIETPIPTTNAAGGVTSTDTPTATYTPAISVEGCTIPDEWQPYQVQFGDTLSEIAFSTETTVAALVEVNCKEDTGLTVNEILYVPLVPIRIATTLPPPPIVTTEAPTLLGAWSGKTEQGVPITFEVVGDPLGASVINVNVSFRYGGGCSLETVTFNSIGSGLIFPPANNFSILNMQTGGANASLNGEFNGLTSVSGNLTANDSRSIEERSNGDCPLSTTISWSASRR